MSLRAMGAANCLVVAGDRWFWNGLRAEPLIGRTDFYNLVVFVALHHAHHVSVAV